MFSAISFLEQKSYDQVFGNPIHLIITDLSLLCLFLSILYISCIKYSQRDALCSESGVQANICSSVLLAIKSELKLFENTTNAVFFTNTSYIDDTGVDAKLCLGHADLTSVLQFMAAIEHIFRATFTRTSNRKESARELQSTHGALTLA